MVEKRGRTAASTESQGQRMLLKKTNCREVVPLSLEIVCYVGCGCVRDCQGCEDRKSRSQLEQLRKDNSCISSKILRGWCGDTFKL